MISLRITPLAPKSAIPTITFIISCFPFPNCPSSHHAAVIITPATISKTNENTRIAVTKSLLSPCINFGKAVVGPTTVVFSSLDPCLNWIQSPINGTVVLSSTPQHTSGSSQSLHTLPSFLYPSQQLSPSTMAHFEQA